MFRVWWGNLKKETLWTTRGRWDDNIKIYFSHVGLECVEWMHLSQHKDNWPAVLNTVTGLRVPSGAGNSLTS